MNQQLKNTKSTRDVVRLISVVLILAIALTCALAFADAAGEIEKGIKTGLGKVYDIVTAIAIPVAAVCLAFCAFQVWVGGEKGMEKAKKTAIYTLVAIAIAYLAPVIVSEVSGWFSSTGTAGVFD